MRRRRVLLCLPERPSEDALALAEAIKAVTTLRPTYPIRFLASIDDDEDAERTPIDIKFGSKPLVLRIEEPPDGGEGAKEDGDKNHPDG